MAFKNLVSFGAGEITHELSERGTLEKFRTGLKTLRNALVTKYGTLKSRDGTMYISNTKDNKKAKYLFTDGNNSLFEFTNGNLREYRNYIPQYNTFDSVHDYNLSAYAIMNDIESIHYTFDNDYIYIFSEGLEAIRINYNTIGSGPVADSVTLFRYITPPPSDAPWALPSNYSWTKSSPTAPAGFDVEYGITFIVDGVESFMAHKHTGEKKPIATGQWNNVVITFAKSGLTYIPDNAKIYQRPADGGAFLYIGTINPTETSTEIKFTFKDWGAAITGGDTPPEYDSLFNIDTKHPTVDAGVYYNRVTSKTGLVYQGRVMFSGSKNTSRLFGTRTGSNAMTRDFPLQDDSAVSLKIGSTGGLKINRLFEGTKGLLIFTNLGLYETSSTVLLPTNAYAVKRGPYQAEEAVVPQMLGPYVTIYDLRFNALIGLLPSGDGFTYGFEEFSIFSSHLFKRRSVVSWALQNSDISTLWIVLDNGNVVSFCFQNDQQMRSWARHDFKGGKVEEVFTMNHEGEEERVYFVINRNGVRTMEGMPSRHLDYRDKICTDSTKIYNENLMVGMATPKVTVSPVVAGEWDGPLTLTPQFDGFTQVAGDIVRIFTDENSWIDLTVTANTLGVITVTPNREYPASMAEVLLNQGVWRVYKDTLTGLDHLNGMKVSIRVDGVTEASPLNTERNYDVYTVTGGSITLPEGLIGSSVHVGLPIVTDIQTLKVDTIEQSPVKLDSQINNKLWISFHESRGAYIGSFYPENDTIEGMDNSEDIRTPDNIVDPNLLIGPYTDRMEYSMVGDWSVSSSVALRNVDPQPVNILAFILDAEIIK